MLSDIVWCGKKKKYLPIQVLDGVSSRAEAEVKAGPFSFGAGS